MSATIPATLCPERASREAWDAIVVGAGVAGAPLAASLAAAGRAVLLLDKASFPRAKTCGGTLNPRAVAALRRLGLGGALASLRPNALCGVAWRQPGGARGYLDFEPDGGAAAVSREALDAALVRGAIAHGAQFLPEARCLSSRVIADRRVLRVRCAAHDDLELAADVVLACDGLGSDLAADAGLAVPARAQASDYLGVSAILRAGEVVGAPADRILMAVGTRGYAGVVRVEDDRWSVAAALRLGALRASPDPARLVREILSAVGVSLGDATESAEWVATRPRLRRRVRHPGAERLLLVGDSAGYAEPITGEGMAWALRGAEMARAVLCDGWSPAVAPAWERAWRRDVRARQWIVRLAGGAARSPLATRAALAGLRLAPALGRWLARALASEPTPRRARA